MGALAYDETSSSDTSPHRNVLLRMLDALAEWLMRQELRVITRTGPVSAGNDETVRR
jgi:hypothetical protein